MKDFNDLKFSEHPNLMSGFDTQAKMFFDNGYGVSVITGGYGTDDTPYELAVLKGTSDKWDITYNTPVTDDVLGYLVESEISEYMKQVQEL